jgi:hypothetical protein
MNPLTQINDSECIKYILDYQYDKMKFYNYKINKKKIIYFRNDADNILNIIIENTKVTYGEPIQIENLLIDLKQYFSKLEEQKKNNLHKCLLDNIDEIQSTHDSYLNHLSNS